MSVIVRDVAAASADRYDVIVVGGGIYGVMMFLEGTLRGQRVLLLEKDDFGAGTSFNNFRIIHGGLRYLQSLNLKRFFESVEARRWFLRTFGAFVKPLPCVMPLYGQGLKRPIMLKTALLLNHLLSLSRNKGVAEENWLPRGGVSRPEHREEFSFYIEEKGLRGCALWYDAGMSDSHRILIEAIRWACQEGGRALNYVHVHEVLHENNRVSGVAMTDAVTGASYEVRAVRVINAAGPSCQSLFSGWTKTPFPLFIKSIAWNVLFEHPTISPFALAVSPPSRKGQTYFVQSWRGKLFAGTGHAATANDSHDPMPTETQLEVFISELNAALPGLKLLRKDVIRVLAGFLPVVKPEGTELATEAVIIDHGKQGSLQGLFSVSGVKFTTAYRVAQTLFDRAGLGRRVMNPVLTPALDYTCWQEQDEDTFTEMTREKNVQQVIEEEAVVHLTDLLFRRLNLMDQPALAFKIADQAGGLLFGGKPQTLEQEITGVRDWFKAGKCEAFTFPLTVH